MSVQDIIDINYEELNYNNLIEDDAEYIYGVESGKPPPVPYMQDYELPKHYLQGIVDPIHDRTHYLFNNNFLKLVTGSCEISNVSTKGKKDKELRIKFNINTPHDEIYVSQLIGSEIKRIIYVTTTKNEEGLYKKINKHMLGPKGDHVHQNHYNFTKDNIVNSYATLYEYMKVEALKNAICTAFFGRYHTYKNNKLIKTDDIDKDDFVANPTHYKQVYKSKLKFFRPYGQTIKLNVDEFEYKNPNTKRVILSTKQTFKKMFKKIKLKHVCYDEISLNHKPYDIKENQNCVHAYMQFKAGKKLTAEHLCEEPDTYDIINFCKIAKINVYVYDILKNLIDKYEDPSNIKNIHYIIHRQHMYIMGNKKELPKVDILYTGDDSIFEQENKNFIFEQIEDYMRVFRKYQQKYSLINYDESKFSFKHNNFIHNSSYIATKKLAEYYNYDSLSMVNILDHHFNLRSYMNNETIETFMKARKIRYYHGKPKSEVKFDINKCYASPLYISSINWPTAQITDYWEKYDGTDICKDYFYYVQFTTYDDILYTNDGIYYGLVLIYIKQIGVKYKITRMFKVHRFKILDKTLLPPPISNIKCENKVTAKQLIVFVGSMRSAKTIISNKLSTTDKDELLALKQRYNGSSIENEYRLKNGKMTHITDDNENGIYNFSIGDQITKTKTGVLINFIITDIVNMKLHMFNTQFLKDNPNAILNGIHTDALGYIFKTTASNNIPESLDCLVKDKTEHKKKDKIQYKKNKYMDEFKFGLFKNESLEKEAEHENSNNTEYVYDEVKIKKFSTLKQTELKCIDRLIKNIESFNLYGLAGYGKSYIAINTIMPLLKQYDFSYIMASSVKKNCAQFDNCVTLQSLIQNKTDNELKKTFEFIDYLIIDESVQLTEQLLKVLEDVKERHKVAYIFLSDPNQCTINTTHDGQSYITTNYFYQLCDYNEITIKPHANIRYTEELHKHILYILDNENDMADIRKYVVKHFQNTNTYGDGLNIAYTNATCKLINDKDGKCTTVHSEQGKTFECDYTINELHKMDRRVLYTAISRAQNMEQIYINTNVSICEPVD